jgi:hypothetical protein
MYDLRPRTAGAAGRQQCSAGAAVARRRGGCTASGMLCSADNCPLHVQWQPAMRACSACCMGYALIRSAMQALLWWLPAAWALRFFGHGSSTASVKPGDTGSAAANRMQWSSYTVLLQWDPRSVVTANELAEWATQYGEASSAYNTAVHTGPQSCDALHNSRPDLAALLLTGGSSFEHS